MRERVNRLDPVRPELQLQSVAAEVVVASALAVIAARARGKGSERSSGDTGDSAAVIPLLFWADLGGHEVLSPRGSHGDGRVAASAINSLPCSIRQRMR